MSDNAAPAIPDEVLRDLDYLKAGIAQLLELTIVENGDDGSQFVKKKKCTSYMKVSSFWLGAWSD